MAKIEEIPSESEWQIMEVLWNSKAPMTSKAVISELQHTSTMTPKMIRVLMNRLCEKGMLSYTVDPNDKRVYHYSVLKSREECQQEKSRRFVNSYFSGSKTNAIQSTVYSVTETGMTNAERMKKSMDERLEKQKEKKEDAYYPKFDASV